MTAGPQTIYLGDSLVFLTSPPPAPRALAQRQAASGGGGPGSGGRGQEGQWAAGPLPGPSSSGPGGACRGRPRVRPAWPPPPIRHPGRRGSRTNTNTGCACLACRHFPARPEENQGKLLSKPHGPRETMGGAKFSCEPRQGAAFTSWGCLYKVGNAVEENNAGPESGSGCPTVQLPGPRREAGAARGPGGAGPPGVRTGARCPLCRSPPAPLRPAPGRTQPEGRGGQKRLRPLPGLGLCFPNP